MELINPDSEDLNNKSIGINNSNVLSPISNSPLDSQNFISGFKNFLNPKLTSIDIEKDNKENSTSEEANRMITSSQEEKEETWRDKLANKIIDKIEVEKSIGIFSLLICIGFAIIILSLFMLDVIKKFPKNYSICFAVGSILVLFSFMFLVGTKDYITKLLDNKRFFILISFILSIFIGIGSSLRNYYIISLIFSGFQLIFMGILAYTYIPRGRAGIDCIKSMITSPFTNLFNNKDKNEINEF